MKIYICNSCKHEFTIGDMIEKYLKPENITHIPCPQCGAFIHIPCAEKEKK